MKRLICTAAALAAGGPAWGGELVVKPLVDARARYESVDQGGLARGAEALTVRVRAGVDARASDFSLLAEAQGTLAAVDAYDDGLHGPANRSLVADPQNVALYRAQLRYARPRFAVTAGRQRIALDDERFVGAVNFRQNGQTFDAVRVEWAPTKALKADLSYAWSDRTQGTGRPLGPVNLQAVYHRFTSDRLVRRYGNEIDLLASAKVRNTTLSLRFAQYRADHFATDTRKLWLQADWAI